MENEMKGQDQGIVAMGTTGDFEALPEGCIANILSFTAPVDACRLSLLSNTFCFAAKFDAVWDRFLPSDLRSIVPETFLIANSSSKKALFLALSDHPIIVDQGKKSFQLDKRSGKKCYMIAPRELGIIWGNTPQYWEWTSMPESRFEEVARLVAVCWFEIRGKINTIPLSPNTQYSVFLVFKMINAHGFDYLPAELSVGITGGQGYCTKKVCLDPNLEARLLHRSFEGLERPNERSDGWLEIEMGEFFNSGLEDDEVAVRVTETESNWWKRGFFLQGIEVRPKF